MIIISFFLLCKVIGDKKGGKTATRLMNQSGILEEIKEALQVQMKFIHITRNPFDNIATIMLRATHSRDAVRQAGAKVRRRFDVFYMYISWTIIFI